MWLLEEQVAWVWIDEVGGRTSEWHSAGVYMSGFTVGTLAKVGARDGTRGQGSRLVLTSS